MTDYSKLTDAEINALVAERVMGWQHIEAGTNVFFQPREAAEQIKRLYGGTEVAHGGEKNAPLFSTDHNHAARMRQRIAELGLCDDFVGWLEAFLPIGPGVQLAHFIAIRAGLNATPRQQCEAALRALDEKQAAA